MNKILYIHKKPCGEVFYVGIGNPGRELAMNRSRLWYNVVNKYGYKIEVLATGLTWELAKTLEVDLISFYGRLNKNKGTLVNLTDGGEGTSGIVVSEERRKIILESNVRRTGIKQKGKEIDQFDLEGNYIKSFRTIKDAQIELKVNNICKVLKNKYPSTGGFTFKYKE